MNFDSAQKKKFMNKLFYGLPPFDQFVAKGDLEETEDIFQSRREVMKKISNQINNAQHSLLIPVVGETGNGKVLFALPDELNTPLTFRFAIKQAGDVVKYLVVK